MPITNRYRIGIDLSMTTLVWAVPNIYILVIMKEDGRDYYQRLGLGRIEEHLWPPDCGVVDILMR